MPSISQRAAAPVVVNDSIPLPPDFPELPQDVKKRFSSLSQWEESLDDWWSKTKMSITDLNTGTSEVINKLPGISRALSAAAGNFTAQLTIEQTVRADADGALASLIITVQVDYQTADAALHASIVTEQTARVTADMALATQINTVSADYQSADATLSASITNEQTARVTADSALATQISTVIANYQAADATLTASITSEATARASADSAIATTITTLSATVTTNFGTLSASITTEQTARVSADTALSDRIDLLVASSGNHVFVQNDPPTATGSNDLWFDLNDGMKLYTWNAGTSTWDDSSDTRITATIAAVATEQTARISADGALATSISSVLAVANGAASAVTTETSARATADGFLEGKYTLTATAGNVVTGMNITSSTSGGTTVSSVTFQTDKFLIYNGTIGKQMFTVSGSSVKLGDTLIVDATNSKVYIGTGTYNNTNTVFYIDSTGQFSLKDKLTWDGSTLTINGVVNITGGNAAKTDLSNVTGNYAGSTSTGGAANTIVGQGAFATLSSASWSSQVSGRPTELTDGRIATAISSAGLVVSGVKPGITVTTGSAGLYLGSDFLGYYNGSAWKTYMDNSGNFYLGGTSGALQWNGSTLTITGVINVVGGGNAATSSDLAGKISNGGAASDVNANSTTIDGGKITANTVVASKLSVSNLADISGTLVIGSGDRETRAELGKLSQGNLQITTASGLSVSTYLRMSSNGADWMQMEGNRSSLPVILQGGLSGTTNFTLSSTGNMTLQELTSHILLSDRGDGRTCSMYTGSNYVQFTWSGTDFQLWIDNTHVGNIQYV